MGRLRKGIWVFNDAGGEYDTPWIEGRVINYREVLVEWLNRAFASSPADRDAAERVGTLIESMNESTAEYFEAGDLWIARGSPETLPFCKTFQEIAFVHDYQIELDLCPRGGSTKWHIAFHCVTAPSGDAYERWQFSNDKGEGPQPLHEKWPEVPKRFNPECQAINAVVFVALEGRLGTIKRCQVKECRRWFLTKDDPRVLCCPAHDVDDLRSGTEERKEQNRDAAKRARKQLKADDEKQWTGSGAAGFVRPGRRRAKYKTERS
jgi:hypothetical protein